MVILNRSANYAHMPIINRGGSRNFERGCTKFSGPELPYSGFDPFWNLLLLPPFESLYSILEYNFALDYMEIVSHRMKQYLIAVFNILVKNKMFEMLHNV